jgi:hypothetical protein
MEIENYPFGLGYVTEQGRGEKINALGELFSFFSFNFIIACKLPPAQPTRDKEQTNGHAGQLSPIESRARGEHD